MRRKFCSGFIGGFKLIAMLEHRIGVLGKLGDKCDFGGAGDRL